jgi:hypothetical protein
MTEPHFVDGCDKTTFAPFELLDWRDSEWKNVRLSFDDWGWLHSTYDTDTIDGYYLNGYGIQGLVFAARIDAGLEPFPPGMEPDSEANTCYIHFSDLDTAVETAGLARQMIRDRDKLAAMVALAREHDLED